MNTQATSPSSGAGPGGSSAGGAGAPGAENGPLPGEQFFHRIRALGVVRPDEGRWVAGVCVGLARRWGLDPLLVRGLFVVAGIVTGVGLGLYGVLWLFLPHPDGRIHAQQLLRGIVTAGFIGSVVFILIDLPLSTISRGHRGPFPAFGNLTFLILLGLGVWWLANRHSSSGPGGLKAPGVPGGFGGPGSAPADPENPAYGGQAAYGPTYGGPPHPPTYGGPPHPPTYGGPPHPPTYGGPGAVAYTPPQPPVAVAPRPVDVRRPLHALTMMTFGAALVAAGAVLGWDRWIGNVDAAGLVATAVALGVVALGIVLAGVLGRRAGWLAPIAVVLAIVAANGATWEHASTSVDRDLSWTPISASAATTGYDLGAGRAVLDLTTPGLVTGATNVSPVIVPASVGVGELVVIVPKNVSSQVDASVGLGGVTDRVGDTQAIGGAGITKTVTSGTNPVLIVNAKVGLGHVEVVPQDTEVAR
jgi:phage shock protein PspC (stress-responsive transcriptional regulator)